MSRLAMVRWVALAALLAGSAGCAPMPIQEPLLAVTRAACDAKPDFTAAVPVPMEHQGGVSATLGADGRCLLLPGGSRTTYAVFALPPPVPAYTIEVVSRVVPRTIVRPVATLFDGSGQIERIVPPDEFESDITGLRAGLRPQATARFLVVAADQARLGEALVLRLGGADGPVRVASAVPIFIPPPIPPTYPDFVRQRTAVFALNGRVTVIASPQRTVRTASAASGPRPDGTSPTLR